MTSSATTSSWPRFWGGELNAVASRWSEERDHFDADAAKRELDGLVAVLENHLRYEERKLVPMLEALDLPADSAESDAVTRVLARAQEG